MSHMSRWPLLFLIASIRQVMAKFGQVYPGFARMGLESCTANMTRAEYTARSNCTQIFSCVMDSVSNYDQAVLGSGAAVLGFIPTLLTLLGSTNDELIRVHRRFPILALLLSITNISTVNDRLAAIRPTHNILSSTNPHPPTNHKPWASMTATQKLALIVLYLQATGGAAAVMWQTVDLGRKGVLTWACWTDFYPIFWIVIAVLQHLLAVISMRLCYRRTGSSVSKAGGVIDDDVDVIPMIQPGTPDPQGTHLKKKTASWQAAVAKSDRSGTKRAASACGVWDWDLQELGPGALELANPNLRIWSKVFVSLLGNANFIYGTIIFSSLSLVSGVNAIKIVCIYGFVAAVTRVLTAYVLDVMIEHSEA